MGKREAGAESAFDELVKAVRELAGPDFTYTQRPIDLKQMRAREAAAASVEIARQRKDKLNSWIDKVHREGRVSGRFTFNTIVRDPLNRDAVSMAEGFCAMAEQSPDPCVCLIQGAEGSGKTVLCNAIANAWMQSTARSAELVHFDDLRSSKLFDRNEGREDKAKRESRWELYCNADLLILDDLCANREGLKIYDQKIFAELLLERYARGHSMVIATVVPLEVLYSAIGTMCNERLKEYSVMPAVLQGGSRRSRIRLNGMVLP